MKGIGYFAVLGALAVAGCSSTNDGDSDPVSFTAVAGGISATGTVTPTGIDVAADPESASATIVADGQDGVAITFAGGAANGRTIGFDIDSEYNGVVQGGASSGLVAGENRGDLTAIYSEDKASFAGFVTVEKGDFDDPQPGDEVAIYAIYGGNPAFGGENTLPAENAKLSYQGQFVGVGTDLAHAEGLRGQVSIDADFGTGDVSGTIGGLTFDDAQVAFGGGNIGFEATMSADKASYRGTSITMGGDDALGAVEGGFYGPGAAETAGAIFADDGAGAVLLGGFQADKQ